jgi:hypothetical protein
MAISLKHGFGSGKLDGTDATLVQPSNWNSDHVLAIGVPKLFGRTTAIGTTGTITLLGVTVASVGVFSTSAAHGLAAGQVVTISGATGMTQINGAVYVVDATNLTSTNFSVTFQGTWLNTSTYSAYTANSGTITRTATGVAEEIAVTGTGSAVLNTTPSITNPTVTNYVETVNPITTGTSANISLASGTFVTFTPNGTATVNMPTAVAGKSFILILTQDVSVRTITWTTVLWASGTQPTFSTASAKSIFSFFSDGTNWYGVTIGQNFA